MCCVLMRGMELCFLLQLQPDVDEAAVFSCRGSNEDEAFGHLKRSWLRSACQNMLCLKISNILKQNF